MAKFSVNQVIEMLDGCDSGDGSHSENDDSTDSIGTDVINEVISDVTQTMHQGTSVHSEATAAVKTQDMHEINSANNEATPEYIHERTLKCLNYDPNSDMTGDINKGTYVYKARPEVTQDVYAENSENYETPQLTQYIHEAISVNEENGDMTHDLYEGMLTIYGNYEGYDDMTQYMHEENNVNYQASPVLTKDIHTGNSVNYEITPDVTQYTDTDARSSVNFDTSTDIIPDTHEGTSGNHEASDNVMNSDSDSGMLLNLYDSSELPESFFGELNNEGVCIVSEKCADVFVNLKKPLSCPVVDTFIYRNENTVDNNNNTVLSNACEADATNCDFEQDNLNTSNEIDNDHLDESEYIEMTASNIKRGRKRVRNLESWSKTINKRRREAGEEYKNRKGVTVPKRKVTIKPGCKSTGNCRKQCTHKFTDEHIEDIHRSFWLLQDGDKNGFYARTITRHVHDTKKKDSRRRNTFEYFFFRNNEKVEVCKDFYLSVLSISDKRYRKYFEKLDAKNGYEYKDMRGRNTKKRISEDDRNIIRRHIESFNRIASHYCRSNSAKEYLEPGLNIKLMYKYYTEHCIELSRRPQKYHLYRDIFNKEYNIGFFTPKKDRCDLCEEIKIRSSNENSDPIDTKTQNKYERHTSDKNFTKSERDKDRTNKTDAIVSFDLENVILLPKANVSNFFYKRKLATYNLTAHVSLDGTAYNCIWNETIGGRGANDIASAVIQILKDIKRLNPGLRTFTLWSDNCIPQNKNSIMTMALKRFMKDNDIDYIVQKFGCPGHSCVQEVDSIHSQIEKVTRHTEIYSPLSLLRILKHLMVRKNPVRFIQMQKHAFMDYQKSIMPLKFNDIQYVKIKSLKYVNTMPFTVGYKLSYEEDVFKTALITTRTTRHSVPIRELPVPNVLKCQRIITDKKRKDITDMLKYMPAVDQQFYKASKIVVL